MSPPDWTQVLSPVIELFNELGVRYQVGGSLASSAWELPRSTQDADLVAELEFQHIEPLVARLHDAYYVEASMIREAIARRSTFNILHLDTMLKVDIFIPELTAFDEATFHHARTQPLGGSHAEQALFTSPEDIVLHKLLWYRAGGDISERQWLDVLGVLKVQAEDLDATYLLEWGTRLGVSELLTRAWQEAGLP